MAKSASHSHQRHHPHQSSRQKQSKHQKWSEEEEKSDNERQADWLLDRQIDIPLYTLLALFVCHALSGTSSLSLPYLSTHLPHSLQTLLPAWARQLPILAPFATDMPNASHDSKSGNYWTTGYAGPFRSDAAGFGHPLTALHNFTRACLGLSYAVPEYKSLEGTSLHHDDLRFGHSYVDRYPWNSWTSHQSRKERTGLLEGTYLKGYKDLFFILTFILVITMARALAIRYILLPYGQRAVADQPFQKTGNARLDEAARRKWRKDKRKRITRFAEQFWSVAYYTCSLSLSFYVARSEPYWMNERNLWAQWPYKELNGLTKAYYLIQCAFSCQQILVINVEAKRKDHWQMFTHHVITIMLLVGSYSFHFTPIGNVVLILMDPSDILLSFAKCLKYMGFHSICDVFFGLFMACWIITRHFFYGAMLWSCIRYARSLQSYQLHMRMTWTLVTLLCALQCLLCIWLVMICRLAWRVVSGQAAEDERSDIESEEEEEVKKTSIDSEIRTQSQNNPSMTTAPTASSANAHINTARKKHNRR